MRLRSLAAFLPTIFLASCTPPLPREEAGQPPPDPRGAPPSTPEESGWFRAITRETTSENGADVDPEVGRLPGDPGKLALYYASSFQTPKFDLYRRVLGQPLVERLTSGGTDERFPRVNPAHPEWLAFASDAAGTWDIYLIDLSKPDRTWIPVAATDADEIAPTWAPDGTRLAWNAFNAEADEWQVVVRDLTTKRESILQAGTSPLHGFLPRWHPKEDLLVLQQHRRRDEPWYALWLHPIGTASVFLLAPTPSREWAAINPVWSPDGRWIAFASVAKSRGTEARWKEGDDLWTVSRDGKTLVQLTNHPAPDWNPTWAPDGRIFFCSKRAGSQNILSIRPMVE